MSARDLAATVRERIKEAAAVKNNDSADTLAFVAIRDGEAWNDRRLPQVGRALTQALAEIDTLAARAERAEEALRQLHEAAEVVLAYDGDHPTAWSLSQLRLMNSLVAAAGADTEPGE